MRKRYPPINGTTTPAMNSSRSRAGGGGFSMLAIEEVVQLPTGRGVVAARRLRILRMIEPPSTEDQPLNSPAQIRPQKTAPSGPEGRSRQALPHSTAKPEKPECLLDGKRVGLRSVGEVVADEAGSFYEVCGRQLRRLGELVRDERGRIYEVDHSADQRKDEPSKTGLNRAPKKPQACGLPPTASASTELKPDQQSRAKPSNVARQTTDEVHGEMRRGYRKILADPGLYLEIPYGRIKNEIAPQLQHAGRLRDGDLIECYAQIYEAQRALPTAEIAARELGNSGLDWQLHPFARDMAQKLGVPELFKSTGYPFETQASTRQLYAGQRVYCIRPTFDPTAERETESGSQSPAPPKQDLALRAEIPQQYLNPIQFKYSREEVLYDMRGLLGTLAPDAGTLVCWLLIYPLRITMSLGAAIVSGRRLKKWRTMLAGKSSDEQLWAVTPPRGFSHHLAVRRWAEETLALEGYDARIMIIEWEIFWRRKGWK